MIIEINKKVIGIPINECFMCNEKAQKTRHHAIPKELKPLRNVTVPLCEKHKDVTHSTITHLYIPKDIRAKLNIATQELNNAMGRLKSIKNAFKIHKNQKTVSHLIK